MTNENADDQNDSGTGSEIIEAEDGGEIVTDGGIKKRTGAGKDIGSLLDDRWENEDYDIENAENWGAPTDGNYQTGTFSPLAINTAGDGVIGGWALMDIEFDDMMLEVYYDAERVHVSFDGESDAIHTSAAVELDTDQARELAAALFQAAEEFDRRPSVEEQDQEANL